jgi:hypothetical protein
MLIQDSPSHGLAKDPETIVGSEKRGLGGWMVGNSYLMRKGRVARHPLTIDGRSQMEISISQADFRGSLVSARN